MKLSLEHPYCDKVIAALGALDLVTALAGVVWGFGTEA
jgi:hypothetical protein